MGSDSGLDPGRTPETAAHPQEPISGQEDDQPGEADFGLLTVPPEFLQFVILFVKAPPFPLQRRDYSPSIVTQQRVSFAPRSQNK